jgi:serine/threonine-protein phosphatase 6 regulatory ankyrin repeat subunit B
MGVGEDVMMNPEGMAALALAPMALGYYALRRWRAGQKNDPRGQKAKAAKREEARRVKREEAKRAKRAKRAERAERAELQAAKRAELQAQLAAEKAAAGAGAQSAEERSEKLRTAARKANRAAAEAALFAEQAAKKAKAAATEAERQVRKAETRRAELQAQLEERQVRNAQKAKEDAKWAQKADKAIKQFNKSAVGSTRDNATAILVKQGFILQPGKDEHNKDVYERSTMSMRFTNIPMTQKISVGSTPNPGYVFGNVMRKLRRSIKHLYRDIPEGNIIRNPYSEWHTSTTIPGGAKKKRVNPKTVKKFATRLYNAAAAGNEETVKEYIEKLQNVGKISANVVGENPDKRTALMAAAENGHIAIVKLLLAVPLLDVPLLDVNAKDVSDQTALMFAAHEGHTDVVEKLLAVPDINVNAKDKYGYTALMWAAGEGHTAIVELLIKADADVDAKDNRGWTALMFASYKGNVAAVIVLLDAGADADAVDDTGATALMFAVRNGVENDRLKIVNLLIAKGVKINAATKINKRIHQSGFTALMDAVDPDNHGDDVNIDIVSALLDAGSYMHVSDGAINKNAYNAFLKLLIQQRSTVLVDAMDAGASHSDAVLVAAKAKFFNYANNLIGHIGDEMGDPDKWPLDNLLEYAKNNNIPDVTLADGTYLPRNFVIEAIVDSIVNSEKAKKLQLELSRYDDVSFKCNEVLGDSEEEYIDANNPKSLIQAASDGDYEKVKLLLDAGANVDATDDYGSTPLIIAANAEPPNLDILKLLIAAGANVNVIDKDGSTALNAVSYHKDKYEMTSVLMTSVLIKAGADVTTAYNAFLKIGSQQKGRKNPMRDYYFNNANNLIQKVKKALREWSLVEIFPWANKNKLLDDRFDFKGFEDSVVHALSDDATIDRVQSTKDFVIKDIVDRIVNSEEAKKLKEENEPDELGPGSKAGHRASLRTLPDQESKAIEAELAKRQAEIAAKVAAKIEGEVEAAAIESNLAKRRAELQAQLAAKVAEKAAAEAKRAAEKAAERAEAAKAAEAAAKAAAEALRFTKLRIADTDKAIRDAEMSRYITRTIRSGLVLGLEKVEMRGRLMQEEKAKVKRKFLDAAKKLIDTEEEIMKAALAATQAAAEASDAANAFADATVKAALEAAEVAERAEAERAEAAAKLAQREAKADAKLAAAKARAAEAADAAARAAEAKRAEAAERKRAAAEEIYWTRRADAAVTEFRELNTAGGGRNTKNATYRMLKNAGFKKTTSRSHTDSFGHSVWTRTKTNVRDERERFQKISVASTPTQWGNEYTKIQGKIEDAIRDLY